MSILIGNSLTTSGPSLRMTQPAELGKFGGLQQLYPDLATLMTQVAAERTNITGATPMWDVGQRFSVGSEPVGVARSWFIGASAALSHANTVTLRHGLNIVLPADTNAVLATSGAPTAAGNPGDVAVDYASNAFYVKGTLAGNVVTAGAAWGAAAAVFPGAGGASAVVVPFATVIPLDGRKFMPPQAIVGALTFTTQPLAARVVGSTCYLKMTADNVTRSGPNGGPVFTGFKQYSGSTGWNNTLGVINDIQFFFDGTDSWYSVTQSTAINTLPTYRNSAVSGSSITATLSGAGLFNAAASLPAPAAFSLTTLAGGTTAVADAVTAVASSVATALQLTKSRVYVAGDVTNLVYTPPAVNPLVDINGNLLFAWSNAVVASSSYILDVLGLASAPGAAAWSMRKLRSSYAGAALQVQRKTSAGVAVGGPTDIGFNGQDLDTSSPAFTNLGTDNLFVLRFYNQAASGAAYDFIQFAGDLAKVVFNATLSKYVVQFLNINTQALQISGQTGIATTFMTGAATQQQMSTLMVALPDASNGAKYVYGNLLSMYTQHDSNNLMMRTADAGAGATLASLGANWKQISTSIIGTVGTVRAQGAGITGIASATGVFPARAFTDSAWYMGGVSGAGGNLGTLSEVIQLATPLTGVPLTTAEQNQRLYWGV